MKKIDPNSQAFPRAGSEDRTSGDMPDGNGYDGPTSGLTVRAYLAAMAMQGLLANSGLDLTFSDAAVSAVKDADALIAELNKQP